MKNLFICLKPVGKYITWIIIEEGNGSDYTNIEILYVRDL